MKSGGSKMIKKQLHQLSVLLVLLTVIVVTGYAQSASRDQIQPTATNQKELEVKYKVTFIELGSVRCIPCKQMQGVMKSIEKKYGNQVKVVFYDVWTPEGKPFGEKFGIEQIPTQVFLDENGIEFSRHVGYFPEKELIALLKSKGVK